MDTADSENHFITEWLWIAAAIAAHGCLLWTIYDHKTREWHAEAVMDGPIRVNRQSGIYHVPTCPQYKSIAAENITLVNTIEEARSMGYRPAYNCGDDFRIREAVETDNFEEPEHPGESQGF